MDGVLIFWLWVTSGFIVLNLSILDLGAYTKKHKRLIFFFEKDMFAKDSSRKGDCQNRSIHKNFRQGKVFCYHIFDKTFTSNHLELTHFKERNPTVIESSQRPRKRYWRNYSIQSYINPLQTIAKRHGYFLLEILWNRNICRNTL